MSAPTFYIWEPRFTFDAAPLSAYSWEFSPTSFGLDNFKHFGLVKLSHVSSADLTLTFVVDGTTQTGITITNSGSALRQTILRVPPMKGKLFVVRLTSDSEFRLDPRDSFFEIRDWGSDGPYRELRIYSEYSLIQG